MNISLVITTYQRAKLLRQSLFRLLELTPPSELIVVDDGGSDETADVVREYMARSGVETTYIYTHHPGAQLCSHARNVGIKRAKYDWIVTSEPELCFRTDAIPQFAELQSRHPKQVISTGRIFFAPDGAAPVYDGIPDWQQAHLWTAPHAALWNRDWLLAVGGWDETFPGAWGWDDTDLLTRLRLSGHGQYIAPEIEAVHLWHPLGGDPGSENEGHFRCKSYIRDESDLTDLVANKEREWGVAKARPRS